MNDCSDLVGGRSQVVVIVDHPLLLSDHFGVNQGALTGRPMKAAVGNSGSPGGSPAAHSVALMRGQCGRRGVVRVVGVVVVMVEGDCGVGTGRLGGGCRSGGRSLGLIRSRDEMACAGKWV